MYIYINVILLFSRVHIPEAEVLGVRFPKEYNHINLGAKHPKLCTYFLQNSVFFGICQSIFPYIRTYMHPRTHLYICVYKFTHYTFIDSLIFPMICIYIYKIYINIDYIYIYVYIHVCGVFF